ncbi:hypothetical protein HDU91_006169 [Kappamyces sp. JEL0680]|nr:hypothetical protein HDU91_006169 [Kappamyces sp. JEL0680]
MPQPGDVEENRVDGHQGRKRICCCFRSRRACISVFIVLIIILALVIYFCFPSTPTVQVGNSYIPPGGRVLLNGATPSITNLAVGNTFLLTIPIANNVSVYSPSYIDVGIKSIVTTVSIKDSSGNIIPNFKGEGHVSDLRFPPRSTTDFIFPVLLTYNQTVTSLLSDPGLQLIQKNCIQANPPSKIDAHIQLTVEVSAIAWMGIKPKFSFDKTVDCPAADQLKNLFKA